MKPTFSSEQLAYLMVCAADAYSHRWNIGKDRFEALDKFIPFFVWHLKQEGSFEEVLEKIDKNSSEYPF